MQHARAARRAIALHLALERTTPGRGYGGGEDGTSAVFQTSKGKNVFEIETARTSSAGGSPMSNGGPREVVIRLGHG